MMAIENYNLIEVSELIDTFALQYFFFQLFTLIGILHIIQITLLINILSPNEC